MMPLMLPGGALEGYLRGAKAMARCRYGIARFKVAASERAPSVPARHTEGRHHKSASAAFPHLVLQFITAPGDLGRGPVTLAVNGAFLEKRGDG